jgi:formylmethanofuran dehydrogenase subunit E
LTALIEIDSEHCATCYADGIQMATGCTFGKGNIRKLGYGKFVLTLVDNRSGRSVRVRDAQRDHQAQPGVRVYPVSQAGRAGF